MPKDRFTVAEVNYLLGKIETANSLIIKVMKFNIHERFLSEDERKDLNELHYQLTRLFSSLEDMPVG